MNHLVSEFLYDIKGGSLRSPPPGCGRPQAAVLAVPLLCPRLDSLGYAAPISTPGGQVHGGVSRSSAAGSISAVVGRLVTAGDVIEQRPDEVDG